MLGWGLISRDRSVLFFLLLCRSSSLVPRRDYLEDLIDTDAIETIYYAKTFSALTGYYAHVSDRDEDQFVELYISNRVYSQPPISPIYYVVQNVPAVFENR